MKGKDEGENYGQYQSLLTHVRLTFNQFLLPDPKAHLTTKRHLNPVP